MSMHMSIHLSVRRIVHGGGTMDRIVGLYHATLYGNNWHHAYIDVQALYVGVSVLTY